MKKNTTPTGKPFNQQPSVNFRNLSISGRFDPERGGGRTWAPISYGSPNVLIAVDFKEFEKTEEEIGKLLTIKNKLPKTRNYKWKTIFRGSF